MEVETDGLSSFVEYLSILASKVDRCQADVEAVKHALEDHAAAKREAEKPATGGEAPSQPHEAAAEPQAEQLVPPQAEDELTEGAEPQSSEEELAAQDAASEAQGSQGAGEQEPAVAEAGPEAEVGGTAGEGATAAAAMDCTQGDGSAAEAAPAAQHNDSELGPTEAASVEPEAAAADPEAAGDSDDKGEPGAAEEAGTGFEAPSQLQAQEELESSTKPQAEPEAAAAVIPPLDTASIAAVAAPAATSVSTVGVERQVAESTPCSPATSVPSPLDTPAAATGMDPAQDAAAGAIELRIQKLEELIRLQQVEFAGRLQAQAREFESRLRRLSAAPAAGPDELDIDEVWTSDGAGDQDFLADAVESSRVAAVTAQEARVEGSRALREVVDVKQQMMEMEQRLNELLARLGDDLQTRALIDRLHKEVGEADSRLRGLESGADAEKTEVMRTSEHATELSLAVDRLSHGLHEQATKLESMQAKSEEHHTQIERSLAQSAQRLVQVRDELLGDLQKTNAQLDGTESNASEMAGAMAETKTSIEGLHQALEDVNTKIENVARTSQAMITPLNNSINTAFEHIKQLEVDKVSAESALKADEVHSWILKGSEGLQRAIENTQKSVAEVHERLEMLGAEKADRHGLVFVEDLQRALTAHMEGLEIQQFRESVLKYVKHAATQPALEEVDSKLSTRLGNMESALIKGLKAISDKVAMALNSKSDALDLEQFRSDVKNRLAHLDRMLQELTPKASLMTRATLHSNGTPEGNNRCTSCNTLISSNSHLMRLGYRDRSATPQKLPALDGVTSVMGGLSSSSPVGASHNARLTKAKQSREPSANSVLTKAIL